MRKGNKLLIKWEAYDNSFKSCTDKIDFVIQSELFSRAACP